MSASRAQLRREPILERRHPATSLTRSAPVEAPPSAASVLQRRLGNDGLTASLRARADAARPLGRTTASHTAELAEEGPGPVSQTLPSAKPVLPVPTPPLGITTRTLAHAPDGKPDTRQTVGVNEQVEMIAPGAPGWTASGGTLTPAAGAKIIWTAPAAGATCTVTATPAKGTPISVSMTVVPPSSRSLVKKSDRVYAAGKSGSGFVATVTIMPTDVSFSRTEVWEGAVNAVASGYYDTVLHWNNFPHPPTTPLQPDAKNNGLEDKVGTDEPGGPGPFSPGEFEWAIPQLHRRAGGSSGSVYSTAQHYQMMVGKKGAEGTAKEGASRARIP